MSDAGWWLAERVSRLLEPNERDAVWGDIAESGDSEFQALAGLMGLAARRQAALWMDWRPWLALAWAVWLGLKLTRYATQWAHSSAIYLWLYVDNWRMADMANSGFWRLLVRESGQIVWPCLLLAIASLASGFIIGMGARRNTWAAGMVYCVTLAVANIVDLPHGPFGVNAAVFALPFYRIIYPPLMNTVFGLLPSMLGMRLGRKFWTNAVNDLGIAA